MITSFHNQVRSDSMYTQQLRKFRKKNHVLEKWFLVTKLGQQGCLHFQPKVLSYGQMIPETYQIYINICVLGYILSEFARIFETPCIISVFENHFFSVSSWLPEDVDISHHLNNILKEVHKYIYLRFFSFSLL